MKQAHIFFCFNYLYTSVLQKRSKNCSCPCATFFMTFFPLLSRKITDAFSSANTAMFTKSLLRILLLEKKNTWNDPSLFAKYLTLFLCNKKQIHKSQTQRIKWYNFMYISCKHIIQIQKLLVVLLIACLSLLALSTFSLAKIIKLCKHTHIFFAINNAIIITKKSNQSIFCTICSDDRICFSVD